MNSDATTQYPDFPGTPTFIINGKMVEQDRRPGTALEPQTQATRSAANRPRGGGPES